MAFLFEFRSPCFRLLARAVKVDCGGGKKTQKNPKNTKMSRVFGLKMRIGFWFWPGIMGSDFGWMMRVPGAGVAA